MPEDAEHDQPSPTDAVYGKENPDVPTPGEELEGDDGKVSSLSSDMDIRTTALHYSVQYNHGVTAKKVVDDAELFRKFLVGIEVPGAQVVG